MNQLCVETRCEKINYSQLLTMRQFELIILLNRVDDSRPVWAFL